ncbi:kelch repeat protein [Gigaspora margarita]|uniref:Kelch repeat protein n=1 Tax=Gigaspora margarita TaxID=4874 RepID=A0A8H3WZF1_GIGMA|nr:kelch repeat protein [Gigaspora margarita]
MLLFVSGAPLADDTIIDSSKWISLPSNPDPNCSYSPFLGGKTNDKLFFTTTNSFDVKNYFFTKNLNSKNLIFIKNSFAFNDVKYIDIFDTTLNEWEPKINLTGTPSKYFWDIFLWVSDNKTGKSYSFQFLSKAIDVFDTINFKWSISASIPLQYLNYFDESLFGSRVLIPSGKIMQIGGKNSKDEPAKLMTRLLTYDTITDSWEIIVKSFILLNTIGEIPDERTYHTAVLSKD